MTKYLKISVEVHDRTQLETVFDYDFQKKNQVGFDQFIDKPHVDVDAFFFLPAQMGINSNSYKKSHFYEDIRPLIRFKESMTSFKNMVRKSDDSEILAFQDLKKNIESLVHNTSASALEETIEQVKLFVCGVVGYYKKKVDRRLKKISDKVKDIGEEEQQVELLKLISGLEKLLKRCHRLMIEFSELRLTLDQTIPANTDLAYEMKLSEEIWSYRFREGLAKIYQFVQAQGQKEFLSHSRVQVFQRTLRAWIRLYHYQSNRDGYLWIDEHSSLDEREKFSSRLSLLKKHIRSILNLEVVPSRLFALRKQIGYIVAAAFAAAWAFFANVMIWQYLKFGGFSGVKGINGFLGVSGLTVLAAFVVAYILQDRIKDMGRLKFHQGVFTKLPDHIHRIVYRDYSGKGIVIGKVYEAVEFLKSSNSVPNDIKSVFGQYFDDLSDEEKEVIHYRKQIFMDRGAVAKINPQIHEIRDIIRFSIRRFLSKLEDPLQSYLSVNRRGQVESLVIPKVYYLDMVLKYSKINYIGTPEEVFIKCKRLVLNKNGLVRIEKVLQDLNEKEDFEMV